MSLSLPDSDQPVYKSDVVSVTGNGSLMISSAKMVHNGRYKCRASNNRGMAEMGVELKIMPREGERGICVCECVCVCVSVGVSV